MQATRTDKGSTRKTDIIGKEVSTMTKTRMAMMGIATVAAVTIMAGAPAVASAEDVQMMQVEGVNSQAVQQVQIDQNAVQNLQQAQPGDAGSDDSQLGDQPGDWNYPDDEVPPADNKFPPDEIVPPDQQPPEVVPPVTVPPTKTETETPHTPSETETTTSRHELPYTGGNGNAFAIGGALIALAGGALLVGRTRKES